MYRARIINSIGVLGTGTVLVIVLLTKLTRGAWITLTIMALLYLVMNRIRRHYRRVSEEVAISDLHDARVCRPTSTPSSWPPVSTSPRCGP